MKLCRFQPQIVSSEKIGATKQSGISTHPEVLQGVISGETVREVSGDIFGKWEVTSRSWPLSSVKLLPPVVPSKIVCVGRNYREHAAEFNNPVPQEPIIFLKPPSSLLAPGDPIVRPSEVKRVDYEGELAVILSRECSQLRDGDDVTPYIAGYTCLNDISARDYQSLDKTWTRAKGFDTFCPLGPWIETELDAGNASVESRLNGKVMQRSDTSLLINSIPRLVEFVSRVMTLLPGDVITTGTPSGIGPMQSGDTVEIEVGGIGILSNTVR